MSEKRFSHKKWYNERQLFDNDEPFAIVDVYKNKQFHRGNETAQMINISKDELIQFMSQRNIHCFIVDELPNISEAEDGAVYIIVDWIADDSIAYCQYYTVVSDMWVTVSGNVDMGEYIWSR